MDDKDRGRGEKVREIHAGIVTRDYITTVKGNLKALFSIVTTTKVYRRALLHSLDCSTLLLIHTL